MSVFEKPHGKHAKNNKSKDEKREDAVVGSVDDDQATQLIDAVSPEEDQKTQLIDPVESQEEQATQLIRPVESQDDDAVQDSDEERLEVGQEDSESENSGSVDDTGDDDDEETDVVADASGEDGKPLVDANQTVRFEALPEIGASDGARFGAQTAYAPIEAGGQPGFVSAGFGEMPQERRRKGLKVFGITAGIIIGLFLVAYIVGAVIFMGRFLPGTTIGGKDISGKPDAEVVSTLEKMVSDYRLDIVGSGFSYRLTGSDIGLSIDADGIVKAMHEDLNAWEWPLLLLKSTHYDETNRLSASYKRDSYEPGLKAELAKYNETAKDPVNATITYDAGAGKFVVQPEVEGTKLNEEAVLKATAEAIDALDAKLSIGDDHLVKPTVYSTDEKLKAAAELASGMVKARVTLVMGGQPVREVTGSDLSSFVTINDQFEVTFRDEDLDAWIHDLAYSFDTVGTERFYTRADGKEIAVSGGVYGWEVDSEGLKNVLLDAIRAGLVGEVEVPCVETAQLYNGPNARDWGARYIDVDISEQYVRFYGDDGGIIWEAPCISGSPDGKHDTGRGVWRVNAKESPSKLIGYENGKKIYETSVTYWMPFEGNGIGFHDATWQPGFGGSMYANGYGSHGCVNLSYSDAQSLYSIIDYDDVVVVHD